MRKTHHQNPQQHSDKHYYLGLDVGGTNLVAGVVDENYNIISKEKVPARAGRSIEDITFDMVEVSKAAVRNAGLRLEDIPWWGIGMPSCINPKTNLLIHANNFSWKNVPIFNYLERHMHIPIHISNDANCAAYGEVLAGAARDCTDAVMLTLGTGVGGGIILNKRIYSGFDTMGAELGHTKLVYNGIECTCGQKGCLESYCSSTALIRQAKEAVNKDKDTLILEMCRYDLDRIDGEMIFNAAKRGDSIATKLFNDYVSFLAAGISSFIVIFRPEKIILGGGIAHSGNFLLDAVNERLYTSTFGAEEIGIPKVVKAELGNDAGIIGAAFLGKVLH